MLTSSQLRILSQRVSQMPQPQEERDLTLSDLTAIGYGADMARRIISLLSDEMLLEWYLRKAARCKCTVLTRASGRYPIRLQRVLGKEAPGCLWLKGDASLLSTRAVALVGSREIRSENAEFAARLGSEAAKQGFTLVSGNARGADKIAQESCLNAGGNVISFVADALSGHEVRERMLYISEDGFDEPFSAQRALSRNRCIHSLAEKTFVAQSSLNHGGTWDGAVKNLRFNRSDVFVFRDGSDAAEALIAMGAKGISMANIADLNALQSDALRLFD